MIIFAITLAIISHYARWDVLLVASIGICVYSLIPLSSILSIQPRGYSDYFADLADSKAREEFNTAEVLLFFAAAYLLIRFW